MQQRPRLLYPSMVIAAITVTVFSLLGIATLTGVLPLAHSEPETALAGAVPPPGAPYPPPPGTTGNRLAEVEHCASCGVVESVSQIEVKGSGTGLGAVAGGVAGALIGNGMGQGNGRTAMTLLGAGGGAYAGNEIEKNTRKSSTYRIRVRMDDGTLRTVYQHQLPAVASGDHVKVVAGGVVQS